MRRMVSTLRLLSVGLLLCSCTASFAQAKQNNGCKPPIGRVLWHDRIDREQKITLKADGKADLFFQAGNNDDINYLVTQTIMQRVDALQCKIETDSTTGDQKKKAYLAGIEKILRNFSNQFKARQ